MPVLLVKTSLIGGLFLLINTTTFQALMFHERAFFDMFLDSYYSIKACYDLKVYLDVCGATLQLD